MIKDIKAKLEAQETPIGIVGLGYVGLPLICLLATKYKTVGYDINDLFANAFGRAKSIGLFISEAVFVRSCYCFVESVTHV